MNEKTLWGILGFVLIFLIILDVVIMRYADSVLMNGFLWCMGFMKGVCFIWFFNWKKNMELYDRLKQLNIVDKDGMGNLD